jgi:predicted ATP-binding protein involved in virulence
MLNFFKFAEYSIFAFTRTTIMVGYNTKGKQKIIYFSMHLEQQFNFAKSAINQFSNHNFFKLWIENGAW